MTIRTSDLGGTDWADGTILYAADQNDTFGGVTFHRKRYTPVGSIITDQSAITEIGSVVIPNAANSILMGLDFRGYAKISADAISQYLLAISGASTGHWYFLAAPGQRGIGVRDYDQPAIRLSGTMTLPDRTLFYSGTGPGAVFIQTNGAHYFQISGANSVFKIYGFTNAGVMSLGSMDINLGWLENIKEE